MQRTAVGLVFSLLISEGLSAMERRGGELWVELVDTLGLSLEERAALMEEVASIYESAGVRILWLREAPVEAPPHLARVYLMERLPRTIGVRLRTFRGDSMGIAMGASGDVSGPVIYVSREAVARSLGGASTPRALGRIVAHELAHRFIGREHTRWGILRGTLHGGDLSGAGEQFFFTDAQKAKLISVARHEPR